MTPDPAAAHDDRDRATADEAASIPPATRDDIPVSWDERTTLTTFLDYARATVHAKCAGIAEEDARRAPLPGSPLMTISGLVSNLRWVEYYWFGSISSAMKPRSVDRGGSRSRDAHRRRDTGQPAARLVRNQLRGTGSWRRPSPWIPPSKGELSRLTEPLTLRRILST
jgi:uncharacterized protein DUF664